MTSQLLPPVPESHTQRPPPQVPKLTQVTPLHASFEHEEYHNVQNMPTANKILKAICPPDFIRNFLASYQLIDKDKFYRDLKAKSQKSKVKKYAKFQSEAQ